MEQEDVEETSELDNKKVSAPALEDPFGQEALQSG